MAMNSTVSAVSGSGVRAGLGALGSSAVEKCSRFFQMAAARWQSAVAAYQFEYSRMTVSEKAVTASPIATSIAIPIDRGRVAALLIGESTVMAVAEGDNFFSIVDGRLKRRERPANPYETADLTLSVRAGRLVVEHAELKTQPPLKRVSNERVALAGESYVVKVIPEAFRRDFACQGELGERGEINV